MFSTARNTLVVAAHPDDEMLGCGGTLARLSAQGAHITILLLGEGPLARGTEAADARANARLSAQRAASVLGVGTADVHFASLPDNRFDTVSLLDIIQRIESLAGRVQPDLVLTHHAGDMNQDHRLTHQAVMTAFRPLPDSNPLSILGFEVLSSTEYTPPQTAPPFCPNVFVDISVTLEKKCLALQEYASEMRPWPHPRSIEAVKHLAALRGCFCGCEAAEAFILYRTLL
ncbi:PIG-L family deacetylase [Desulfovibrio sp. PG-178-WT-4]|uniref:PIG-L family deacetylase n=1 Tax=Desulfovibrio porci TaxID=2605782 RepID=A0A6L5XKN1_9BACT|nr:PIG-L deacetylase family protein [Desulfovibrio porci]MSS27813.1 PIG-L family deacetylase [Desulfovibrio porci]